MTARGSRAAAAAEGARGGWQAPPVGLAFLCLAPLLVAGCLEGRTERPRGERCSSSDECAGSLVCVYGRCRSSCLFDADCEGEGATCIPAPDGAGRVCWYPTYDTGGEDGGVDCPPGSDFLDGACREPCDDGDDCGEGRECFEGVDGSYCVDSPGACTADDPPAIVPGSEQPLDVPSLDASVPPAIAWGDGTWAVAARLATPDSGLECVFLDSDGAVLASPHMSTASMTYGPPAVGVLADGQGAALVSVTQETATSTRLRYVRMTVGGSIVERALEVDLGEYPGPTIGVASLGDAFAVTWIEGSATATALVVAVFEPEGREVALTSHDVGVQRTHDEAAIAAGGSHFGIAFASSAIHGDRQIGFGSATSDLGDLEWRGPIPVGDGYGLDVAWGGTGWGVVVAAGGAAGPAILFHELGPEGEPTGPVVTVTEEVADPTQPALAWGEGAAPAAVAWEAPTGGGGTEVRLALVRRGAAGPTPEIVVGDGGRSPDLAFDGSRFGIVWLEGPEDAGELRFALIDPCP